MRQGQFMVYSQGKPRESVDVINTEDYSLRVKKTWVAATNVWHIEFQSQSIQYHRFEMFLTQEELKRIRDFI